ncbi:thioredoxin-like domain-containing protein [Pontiella sulfatireligans]|uniref:Sporulation thiol-disulfide oxidoreductase A n=1 Tax=Pontiella sulfatireligans TaxID=2750658 RepID=A0A6C2UN31_9BACT|nr:thioredoxin-like domain-containing protein [Pontiella sulfatireligans]VGO21459.1 Sporulation thiol-disulfide oxidoreductase A [Pontiella sulfatireligans]
MKTGITILSLTALALLSGCDASKKAAPFAETLRDAAVDAAGNPVKADRLLETDYLLLYFSAHWCPPCQAFTPRLVDFYRTNGGGRLFQTLLVSNDRSQAAMFDYIKETGMPWPAMSFRSRGAKQLTSTYSGDGIPRLVLLNPAGEILSDSFKGREYVGPQSVLDDLKKRLAEQKVNPSEAEKPPSTLAELAKKYRLEGFGQGSEQKAAIINGIFITEGAELDPGIMIERITGTYVEVSYEGNLYRLYP